MPDEHQPPTDRSAGLPLRLRGPRGMLRVRVREGAPGGSARAAVLVLADPQG